MPCPAHSLTLAAIAFASTQGKHVNLEAHLVAKRVAMSRLAKFWSFCFAFRLLLLVCLLVVWLWLLRLTFIAVNVMNYLIVIWCFCWSCFCLHAQADLARLHAFVVVPGDC